MATPDYKNVMHPEDKDTPIIARDNNEDIKDAYYKVSVGGAVGIMKSISNAVAASGSAGVAYDATHSLITSANNDVVKNAINADMRSTVVNVARAVGSTSGPGTAVVAGISAGVVYDATHSYITGEPQGILKNIRDAKEDN